MIKKIILSDNSIVYDVQIVSDIDDDMCVFGMGNKKSAEKLDSVISEMLENGQIVRVAINE